MNMAKRHMKRLTIPKTVQLPRKTEPWAVKPSPGPHRGDESVPLLVSIRDYLHLCNTAREGRMIIGGRKILVDGKVATDYKRPLGFMDVLSIPGLEKHYRVLLDARGKIRLVEIPKKNSVWKLVRIENKTTLKGGEMQLNLHDGRNIRLKPKEAGKYKSGDTIKIEVPGQKILGHYKLQGGNLAMIIRGRHAGELANITEYKVSRSPMSNKVYFEGELSTVKRNTFVVGKTKPEVVIPEV